MQKTGITYGTGPATPVSPPQLNNLEPMVVIDRSKRLLNIVREGDPTLVHYLPAYAGASIGWSKYTLGTIDLDPDPDYCPATIYIGSTQERTISYNRFIDEDSSMYGPPEDPGPPLVPIGTYPFAFRPAAILFTFECEVLHDNEGLDATNTFDSCSGTSGPWMTRPPATCHVILTITLMDEPWDPVASPLNWNSRPQIKGIIVNVEAEGELLATDGGKVLMEDLEIKVEVPYGVDGQRVPIYGYTVSAEASGANHDDSAPWWAKIDVEANVRLYFDNEDSETDSYIEP